MNEFCTIQHLTIHRGESIEWADHLRFLIVPPVRNKKRKRDIVDGDLVHQTDDSRSLTLTSPVSVEDPKDYLAVSYTWQSLKQCNSMQEPYLINHHDKSHASQVRPEVLDRAIRYARHEGISKIWIDRECIDNDSRNQAIGVQAMDIVYRRARRVVAPLEITISSQTDLDALTMLLRGRYVTRTTELSKAGQRDVRLIISVLRTVTSDLWWTRAWTFQEDHCASANMYLLVEHAGGLEKDRRIFGYSRSELRIPMIALRKESTRFLLAAEDARHTVPEGLLQTLKQYNILNHFTGRDLESSTRFRGSSWDILDDVVKRDSEFVADKLAILANCLRYSRRLDTRKLTKQRYGLTACLMTLCLMNGEIFHNHTDILKSAQIEAGGGNAFSLNVSSCLDRILFDEFHPPGDKYQLSTIASYRFNNTVLTPAGIRTKGWLWQLGPPLRIDFRPGVDDYDEKALIGQLGEQGQAHLAVRISRYLTEDRQEGTNKTKYMDSMLEATIEACDSESAHLRPAHLVNRDTSEECCGLFITDAQDTKYEVFTSSPDYRSGDEGDAYDVYTVASLGVEEQDPDRQRERRLLVRQWVNGLWFVNEKPRVVVFPLVLD